MSRNLLIVLGVAAAAGAGWFYYQSGKPTDSEVGLLESCLLSEDMVRLNDPSVGVTLTTPADQSAMCEGHRQKLGSRKVRAITDRYREDQAYRLNYGTPAPAFDPNSPQVPAPAAATPG